MTHLNLPVDSEEPGVKRETFYPYYHNGRRIQTKSSRFTEQSTLHESSQGTSTVHETCTTDNDSLRDILVLTVGDHTDCSVSTSQSHTTYLFTHLLTK